MASRAFERQARLLGFLAPSSPWQSLGPFARRTTAWQSIAAASLPQVWAELSLMDACVVEESWAEAALVWQTC